MFAYSNKRINKLHGYWMKKSLNKYDDKKLSLKIINKNHLHNKLRIRIFLFIIIQQFSIKNVKFVIILYKLGVII